MTEEALSILVAPIERPTLERNPAAVYLAGLAPGSRRAMHQALNVIAALLSSGHAEALTFSWHQLRYQHTAAVRAQLAERYAAATANKMLAALRGVLRASWRLGQISAEDYQVACDIGAIRSETLPAGRNVSIGELASIMGVCAVDTGPLGIRDSAICALLYGCGLRRAELVALDTGDYDPVDGTLRIQGKRNKQRLVPVVGNVQEALHDWLQMRGSESGPLFVRIYRGGHLSPQSRLTTQAVYTILAARARQAGVKPFSPHDLRRTFVGDLLEAGADIVTVQKLAGHSNVTTTARYDRRGEATKRKAAKMLHVPYFKRTDETSQS